MQSDNPEKPTWASGEFITGDMILSTPGELVQIYRLEGAPFETASDEAIRRAVAAMGKATRRVIAVEVGRDDDGRPESDNPKG